MIIITIIIIVSLLSSRRHRHLQHSPLPPQAPFCLSPGTTRFSTSPMICNFSLRHYCELVRNGQPRDRNSILNFQLKNKKPHSHPTSSLFFLIHPPTNDRQTGKNALTSI